MPRNSGLLSFSTPVASDLMVDAGGIPMTWIRSDTIRVQGFSGDVLVITGAQQGSGDLNNTTPTPLLFYAYRDGRLVNVTQELNLDLASTVINRDILIADLNSNGLDDIFLSNHGTEKFSPFPGERNTLLIQNADGTFSDQSHRLPEWTDFSHGSTIGDFNGDGHNDIYVNNLGDDDLTPSYFLINDGTGHFTQDPVLNAQVDREFQTAGFGSGYMAVAVDIFDNGRDDLFLGKLYAFSGETADGYLFNQGGRFSLEFDDNFYWPGSGDGVFSYWAVDYNRNGLQDILVFATDDDMVTEQGTTVGGRLMIEVYNNLGSDGFKRATSEVFDLSPLGDTYLTGGLDVDFYDVTSNGFLDLEVRAWTSDWQHISLFFANNGSGYAPPIVTRGDGALPRGQYGDFNGDGIVDFAYQEDSTVMVRYGQLREGALSGEGAGQVILAAPERTELQGTQGDDILVGGPGDDVLIGGPGDDFLNGAIGYDTARFQGPREAYTIATSEQAGYLIHEGHRIALPFQVADSQPGRDGTDRLISIERLAFSDAVIDFDLDGNAGQAYRLYEASFDRAADASGLGYWVHRIENDTSLLTVAESFIDSDEFTLRYGRDIDDTTFIEALYLNVLDRLPDRPGLEFWLGEANAGMSRGEILTRFSESLENRLNAIETIGVGIHYEPWEA